MTILKNFGDKNFIEQAKILSEIEKGGKVETIPELFELHENPLGDQAVDSMVTHTLRALLSQSEVEIIKGIQSDKTHIKTLCIHMAGENRIQSTGPMLMELVSTEKNPDTLFEILSSLSKIKAPGSLEFIRKNISHPDPVVAALCIETLGLWDDIPSLSLFTKIIEDGERDDRYEECDLLTWNAIKAVAALQSDKALFYLVSKIDHRSPAARRIIHQELTKKGRQVISFLVSVFWEDDVDAKIHAAQLLGLISDQKAGDVLIGALASGSADHPNIKYTIYESLGNLAYEKGIDRLIEGLSEEDELVLLAVISALNKLLNSKVTEKLGMLISAGDAQSERIINAILTSKSLKIFEVLYSEHKTASEKLLLAIIKAKDPVIRTSFRAKLKSMKSGETIPVIEEPPPVASHKDRLRILAVDDSRLLLFFYRSAVTKLDLDITTAINGAEAMDILEKGEEFDLIVTDLNMPVMDGIEFTKKVRAHTVFGKIPILMATTESKQSQVDLAKKVGVSDFIQKPFSEEVFQKKIKSMLASGHHPQ